jgi:hypothetical protein
VQSGRQDLVHLAFSLYGRRTVARGDPRRLRIKTGDMDLSGSKPAFAAVSVPDLIGAPLPACP